MHVAAHPTARRTAVRVALVALLAPLVASPAAAREAGTGTVVPAAPVAVSVTDAQVTFTGHGWGHGRGMGQYGALGYAVDHGWSWKQILDHYYGGTTLGDAGNPEMTVELTGLNGKPLVVVGTSILVNGQPIGATAARFTADANGNVRVEKGDNCAGFAGQPGTWTFVRNERTGATRVTTPNGKNANAALGDLIRVCEPTLERAYRGELSVVWHGSGQMTINHLPTESYLRGVVPRESPSSWGNLGGGRGLDALRAQAVAARSYALSSSRASGAKTCDTTACQVYQGAGVLYPGKAIESLEAANTDRAIADTVGKVRLMPNGAVARTEFSSSTGGHTAGGTFPAVPDAGDAYAGNPNHTWTATMTMAQVAAKLGVPGPLRDLRVTARNGLGDWGGRVIEMQYTDANGRTGTIGNRNNPINGGESVRSRLGLKSDWFTLSVSSDQRREAENVVRALYRDVLGRNVDATGLATWTSYILQTGDTAGLVRGIATSRERMQKLVTAQYQTGLGRNPDPTGLAHWTAYLESGRGVYDLQVGIYSSAEALEKLGGGDVNAWVGGLYEKILGRTASTSERAFWADIAQRQGRSAVAAAIAQSTEASLRRLNAYYQTFLLRNVDPAGQATFLPLMTGRGDFLIPEALGSSPEYWRRAQSRTF
jgi:SpoIID/LytB domain protein